MTVLNTETQAEISDKAEIEILSSIKPNGVNANDNKKLIDEKPQHKTTKSKPNKFGIVWDRMIILSATHLGALYYAVYSGISEAKLLTILYGIILSYSNFLALSIGGHRYYSHRSFKANKYIRFLFVFLQTMTVQRSMWVWAKDHRQHHKYSDTVADPHNASKGFFFSHIGWSILSKHPEVYEKSHTINTTDLDQDAIVTFQRRHYKKLLILIGVIIPTLVPYLLWNETLWNSFFIGTVFRLIGSWHLIFIINSASHLYGSRPYSKDIAPTENKFVSLLTLGDGTHNYHHAFPWDYRTGEKNSAATMIINFFLKNGWAYDPKYVSEEQIKRHAMKKGDNTHSEYML